MTVLDAGAVTWRRVMGSLLRRGRTAISSSPCRTRKPARWWPRACASPVALSELPPSELPLLVPLELPPPSELPPLAEEPLLSDGSPEDPSFPLEELWHASGWLEFLPERFVSFFTKSPTAGSGDVDSPLPVPGTAACGGVAGNCATGA